MYQRSAQSGQDDIGSPARLTFSQGSFRTQAHYVQERWRLFHGHRGLALAEDVVGSAGDLFDYAVNGVQDAAGLF